MSQAAIDPRLLETVIREGLELKGGMIGKGHVTIAGKIEGNVDVRGRVTIQPKGHVLGDIAAAEVVVSGNVKGNIQTQEKLTVNETGRVEGDVTTPSIHIAEGAKIVGRLTVDTGVSADS